MDKYYFKEFMDLKKFMNEYGLRESIELANIKHIVKYTISDLLSKLLNKSVIKDIQRISKKNYEIKQHEECLKGFFYKGNFYCASLELYYPKREYRSLLYLDPSLNNEAFNFISRLDKENLQIVFLQQYIFQLLKDIHSLEDLRNQIPDIIWENSNLNKKYPDLVRTKKIIIEDKDTHNKMIDIFSYYIFFNLIN